MVVNRQSFQAIFADSGDEMVSGLSGEGGRSFVVRSFGTSVAADHLIARRRWINGDLRPNHLL